MYLLFGILLTISLFYSLAMTILWFVSQTNLYAATDVQLPFEAWYAMVGSWYPSGMNWSAEYAGELWLFTTGVLTGLYLWYRYINMRERADTAANQQVAGVIARVFDDAEGKTLAEVVANIEHRTKSLVSSSNEQSGLADVLVRRLRHAQQQLKPLEGLQHSLAWASEEKKIAEKQLTAVEDDVSKFRSGLAQLVGDAKPLLDKTSEIEARTTDLKQIEEALAKLSKLLGGDNAEGFVTRTKMAESRVSSLSRATSRLKDFNGDGETLEEVLANIRSKLEDEVVDQETLKNQVEEIEKLEGMVRKTSALFGDVDLFVMRIQQLKSSVERLKSDDERILLPFGEDAEVGTLEDFLQSTREKFELDFFDESRLKELLDELDELERMAQELRTAYGDVDVLVRRVKTLKSNIEALESSLETMDNPLNDGDSLEHALAGQLRKLEELERFELGDQVDTLRDIERDFRAARQKIIDAADRLRNMSGISAVR